MTLKPPHTEGLTERQAAFALFVARYVAILLLCLSGGILVAWLVLKIPQLLAYSLTTLPIIGIGFAYPTFHQRGHARLGTTLLLCALLIVQVATPILMPEFQVAALLSMVAAVMFGFMMLGSRDGVRFGVAYGLCLVAVTLINQYTPLLLFAPLRADVSFVINLTIGVSVVIAAVVVSRLITHEQEMALNQWQQASRQLETAAEEAREGRARLEEAIEQYNHYMAAVSSGKMLVKLPKNGHRVVNGSADEPLITLGESLVAMTANLQGMILRIKETAANISDASSEILAANTQQVTVASENSAAIAQTTTTVDEMKVLAEHVLARAQQVAEAAQRTMEVSQSGRRSVADTIQSMQEIRARVEGIAESSLALSEKTQQIGEIISTVHDLADQSHMLALNASIEASRAGEMGKGFAVVALEMRRLAEQSSQAALQIKEILSEIQQATNSTVMATEEGSKGVDRGVRLAEQSRAAIEQLAQAIEESAQTAAQMTAGGRQQLTGVEQVVATMRHINEATAQSVASSRQTENAARNLNELSQSMGEMIERYEV